MAEKSGEKEMRFSDEQLVLMQKRFEAHIVHYDAHCAEEDRRWAHLLAVTEKNQENLATLCASTGDLVSTWQAANGALRVGISFGKFVKWCTQLAVVGVAVSWLLDTFGS